MAYDNNMSGVLFANEKDGNEKRPDYKGTVTINGQSYDLAGWKRTSSKSGKSFLSLKVSEPRGGGGRQHDEASDASPF